MGESESTNILNRSADYPLNLPWCHRNLSLRGIVSRLEWLVLHRIRHLSTVVPQLIINIRYYFFKRIDPFEKGISQSIIHKIRDVQYTRDSVDESRR